ncbi:LysR family transcriptional regulator [Nitrospirillum sp. BR 11164]|uniref:LysR family transcriptional regulator n=1 Tax=Nitrospirillum sp. BR 11164 TaxID=3104324 RepID=UPI002AFE0668|nr:LysR family transcriptional regulator [Nitrospirillum sp. BR 11164]MEA1651307.1 LysR family transcriptional regulator [Nitrospirillum sp. BR 11164]
MTKQEPGWELYRSFLAVLREGSLSAAGRVLGLTQPSVGRHVEELERALGAALFTRSPQGLTPTATALELRGHAEVMAAAAAALLRTASGPADEVAGSVRVTASEVMGVEVLPPILADFRRDHPKVAIEVSLSNEMEDVLRRDADIAVRMVRPTQGALVARHLGVIPLGLHAHCRYLEWAGTPTSMEDVGRHSLIGFDTETAAIRALRAQGIYYGRDRFAFRADSDVAQLAAIRAGIGIGICQLGLARRDPDLVHLLPGALRITLDTWLVMHPDLKSSRRVRLLYDHLALGLAAYIRTGQ